MTFLIMKIRLKNGILMFENGIVDPKMAILSTKLKFLNFKNVFGFLKNDEILKNGGLIKIPLFLDKQ